MMRPADVYLPTDPNLIYVDDRDYPFEPAQDPIESPHSYDMLDDASLAMMRVAVERLPSRERDVVDLIYARGWHQVKVGWVMDLTQQAISARIRSSWQRVLEAVLDPRPCEKEIRRVIRRLHPGMAPRRVRDAAERLAHRAGCGLMLDVWPHSVRSVSLDAVWIAAIGAFRRQQIRQRGNGASMSEIARRRHPGSPRPPKRRVTMLGAASSPDMALSRLLRDALRWAKNGAEGERLRRLGHAAQDAKLLGEMRTMGEDAVRANVEQWLERLRSAEVRALFEKWAGLNRPTEN